MKFAVLIPLVTLTLALSGCSPEKKAAELLDTARFEEKQSDREHAIKLYEEIMRRYPKSKAAVAASQRLEALEATQALMSVPQISILMPIRNEARYLQAALSSLFRQTTASWELIAIDDGSTDATPDMLAAAAEKDARVRVIRLEAGGLVTALNTGLGECRAPLIARMDGDDISHPRRLASQSTFLRCNPDVGLVACNFKHFPRSELKQGMASYETWQNRLDSHDLIMRDRFVESPFVHPSVMVRRALLEQVGGYQANGWAEDYDLWLRLAETGTRFVRLDETLFFWRDHTGRATRTLADYTASAFRQCKACYLRRGFLKDAKKVIIAGAGLEGRAWQRLLAQENIGVSCWLDVDPRKVGHMLHGAPVLLPTNLPQEREKMIVAIGVRGAREEFRDLAPTLGASGRAGFHLRRLKLYKVRHLNLGFRWAVITKGFHLCRGEKNLQQR